VFTRHAEDFGRDGVPRWSEPRLLAGVSRLQNGDPYYHDVPRVHGVNDPSYPVTGGGLLIVFNPGVTQGFHLGALRPGIDGWIWRASRAGKWEVDSKGGILTRDGTYETGRRVQYPGNVALAVGGNIVFGFHGEAWNSGEANQWMHFHENGLFLGQFGEPAYADGDISRAKPGSAGNAFSPSLVEVDGELYLWHNDESVHGGVHRWHIIGASGIRIQSAPIDAR